MKKVLQDGYHMGLQVFAHSAGQLQSVRGLSCGENKTCSVRSSVNAGDHIRFGQLLASVATHAATRAENYQQGLDCLRSLHFDGIENNITRLISLLSDDAFITDQHIPHTLAALPDAIPTMKIIQPGIQTTVQDTPGRVGYWDVGVPPSGPMDDLGLRLANECVGNTSDAAGLEITLGGLQILFSQPTVIALGGAPSTASCGSDTISYLQPFTAPADTKIIIPPPQKGFRVYLAVRGGIDCASYLGSRATFTLGGFGGFQGRELQAGDELPLGSSEGLAKPAAIPASRKPRISHAWKIGVRIGPHTSPDFITEAGMEEFFSAKWTVSSQSNRTGVRLDGPKPQWARTDGGEAGLHPSNLHDNAYAFGAIDLTGDLPVILGPDGPSLGGFVCPGILVSGQRWKLGQLRPGDTVEWVVCSEDEASALRTEPHKEPEASAIDSPIILDQAQRVDHPGRKIRRQGDEFMLIEFGQMELELGLRLRVQSLYERLEREDITGILDIVPGIRSLQVHFNPDQLSESTLAKRLAQLDDDTDLSGDVVLPSRTVKLPLSWDDPSTRKAIDIYMQTVNPDAPWCPWNIEFIRRINGLDSVDDVQRIVFDASYLVYGLGDVYLGAPVATPVDPRHRMVTTKYNPARTWTPENAVGIGGAYMCIYGMEGPGGYQFVGRTVQVWNTYPRSDCFVDGKPWLLRQFDQIQFYSVSADELLQLREDFPAGRWQPTITEGALSLAEYNDFVNQNRADIEAQQQRQRQAFAEERARWEAR